MSDDGKPFIMRTLATTVAQWVWIGKGHTEITLWTWSSEVRCISSWSSKSEFPAELLSCGGSANSAALIQLLGDEPGGKILLLTDGFWSRDDAKTLKRWKDCLPSDTLRIIKIGADANPKLKGIDVFSPEEIFDALDGWQEDSLT